MDETQREPRLTRTASVGALSVLPIFVTLAERAVVVAGGSPAATWKAELLAAAGARVAVFADQPCEELRALASDHDRVTLQARRWRAEDLVGAAIAVADLDGDDARDFVIAARAAGAPVNLIDQPGLGDFQFGVIVERTPLVVGVSTRPCCPSRCVNGPNERRPGALTCAPAGLILGCGAGSGVDSPRKRSNRVRGRPRTKPSTVWWPRRAATKRRADRSRSSAPGRGTPNF
jgi:hypothetical protein